MALPTSRPHGPAPASKRGGGISARGPGELDYQPANGIGLDRLPAALLDALVAKGFITVPTFIDWVDDAVTKRRPDGSHYQQMGAWWASEWQLCVATFCRELAKRRDGRFKPAGEWLVEGTTHHLPTGITPERSVW